MSDDPVLAAIARLEAGNARLEALTAGLETGLDTLRREARADLTELRVAMMGRMDRLQGTMTGIRDDIGVAMGSADAMQRANDNTRELVRLQGEQLTIMFRQIKRLGKSGTLPAIPETTAGVPCTISESVDRAPPESSHRHARRRASDEALTFRAHCGATRAHCLITAGGAVSGVPASNGGAGAYWICN